MNIVNSLLNSIVEKMGKSVQGTQPSQANRDYHEKGSSYSVEAEISEALADLMLMLSTMPVSGDSERARWLDEISDKFFRIHAKKSIAAAFLTGDAIVVPSWNGRSIANVVVSSDDFEVMGCEGDELTSVAYVVDRATKNNEEYTLMQAVELVRYDSDEGERMANRYRMFVARGGSVTNVPIGAFPQWKGLLTKEWYIPNVDRLLVGRFKSFAIEPQMLNTVKGIPICYGASQPIGEIHYLLDAMHDEFELSEKAIIADKRLFERSWEGGELRYSLPKGRDRLFMRIGGAGNDMKIEEWAPEVRYMGYLEAIDKQERLVERAVGVSHGIISAPNEFNYQNMDNVRKSQQKTMSFVSTARKVAEDFLGDLVYAWDTLANYYDINPVGDYEVSFDWSDEYIESYADRQQSILAGIAVGATDATDYRMFVMKESPEAARERVEEIEAAKYPEPMLMEAENGAA